MIFVSLLLVSLVGGGDSSKHYVPETVLSSPSQLLSLYSSFSSLHPRPASEQRLRLGLFRKSVQFVLAQNREQEWKSGLNLFSDMTDVEARG